MTAVFIIIAALLLDAWLGEPRRWHPLVGFGVLADRVERRRNTLSAGVGSGAVAAALLVVPPVAVLLVAGWLLPGWLWVCIEVVGLYLALGLHSLRSHARAVLGPLANGDLDAARRAVGQMVSRDTAALDARGVSTAATESVLENGADAVFATLFWFAVAGLPGVVLHRLVNTLDAMWGYRTPRYNAFGRCVARVDDVLNWVPARLTALAYALVGRTLDALICWRRQGGDWESPNAGPVMAAGAGAIGVVLGGPAPYSDGLRQRPTLGDGSFPGPLAAEAALVLVYRAVFLWLAVMATGAVAWALITAGG